MSARFDSLTSPEWTPAQLPLAVRAGIVLTILAVIAVVVSIAMVDRRAETSMASLNTCISIVDGAGRLACYDRLAREALPQPAKGANAPL